MQITIDLPDDLVQTNTFNESDWLREIAIALFQQNHITLQQGAQLTGMPHLEFQQLLTSRDIVVPQAISNDPDDELDPDDTPTEVVLEGIRQGWHEAMTGQTYPISQLWDGIDAD